MRDVLYAEGYKNLARMIIIQAVKDYKDGKNYQDKKEGRKIRKECKAFLLGKSNRQNLETLLGILDIDYDFFIENVKKYIIRRY